MNMRCFKLLFKMLRWYPFGACLVQCGTSCSIRSESYEIFKCFVGFILVNFMFILKALMCNTLCLSYWKDYILRNGIFDIEYQPIAKYIPSEVERCNILCVVFNLTPHSYQIYCMRYFFYSFLWSHINLDSSLVTDVKMSIIQMYLKLFDFG